ncbi:hypothetical protein ACX1C1_04115 [Paenibacillus sp. strain BS8-2]
MKQGLMILRRLLILVTDASIPSEVKESEVASWIVNDAPSFVDEVSAGLETIDIIATISTQAIQKGADSHERTN